MSSSNNICLRRRVDAQEASTCCDERRWNRHVPGKVTQFFGGSSVYQGTRCGAVRPASPRRLMCLALSRNRLIPCRNAEAREGSLSPWNFVLDRRTTDQATLCAAGYARREIGTPPLGTFPEARPLELSGACRNPIWDGPRPLSPQAHGRGRLGTSVSRSWRGGSQHERGRQLRRPYGAPKRRATAAMMHMPMAIAAP